MKIHDDILRLISECEVEGNVVRLPPGQLNRKVYEQVNAVLMAIGGKWNRSAKGHVFPEPAGDVIEEVIATGEYRRTKQDFGQFDTPPDLVARVIAEAQIEPGMRVLEPSAGIGNIAFAAAAAGGSVLCYEIDEKRCDALVRANNAAPHRLDMVIARDFMGADPTPVFDRVVMNPPFSRQADIDHVRRAFGFLRFGGRLVAIMSASVTFRSDRKTVAFREFVAAQAGTIERLPEGSFKAAGTSVNTCLVVIPA